MLLENNVKYLFVPVKLTVAHILDSGTRLTIIFLTQQSRALGTEIQQTNQATNTTEKSNRYRVTLQESG